MMPEDIKKSKPGFEDLSEGGENSEHKESNDLLPLEVASAYHESKGISNDSAYAIARCNSENIALQFYWGGDIHFCRSTVTEKYCLIVLLRQEKTTKFHAIKTTYH